jgi:hypothetical protein
MNKHTFKLVKPFGCPPEYFDEVIAEHERKHFYGIISKLSVGEWFTMRIEKEVEPNPASEFDMIFKETIYVGKVTPVHMEWKMPKKLSWKERLRALFTGEVTSVLVETS